MNGSSFHADLTVLMEILFLRNAHKPKHRKTLNTNKHEILGDLGSGTYKRLYIRFFFNL